MSAESAAPAAGQTTLNALQWRLLLLLVFSVCINYIDRGALSVAVEPLKKELQLGDVQVGFLLSAFFWTYALCQMLAGWLVDRFAVSLVFGIAYLLWSAATCGTGLATGFASLFAIRLLLGVGESVAYPAYSKLIASNYGETQRGFANALVDAGSKAGPALGTLIGGLLVSHLGWRTFFVSIGLLSLAWLLPWYRWAPRTGRFVASRDDYIPSIWEIMKVREAWGTFIGLFCGNYTWYFLLTWLPSYFVRERHFSLDMMAMAGSVPYWGIAASATAGGWLSDRWIARGGSPTRVRKTFVCGGLLGAILMLPAAMAPNVYTSLGLLFAACLSFGMWSSNNWAVTQTLAGPCAAGKWTGMQNCIGNFAGVVAPAATGFILARTGSFLFAFLSCAVCLLVGASMWLFVVRRIEPVQWRNR